MLVFVANVKNDSFFNKFLRNASFFLSNVKNVLLFYTSKHQICSVCRPSASNRAVLMWRNTLVGQSRMRKHCYLERETLCERLFS